MHADPQLYDSSWRLSHTHCPRYTNSREQRWQQLCLVVLSPGGIGELIMEYILWCMSMRMHSA
jgi:hypothetical protein